MTDWERKRNATGCRKLSHSEGFEDEFDIEGYLESGNCRSLHETMEARSAEI